MSKSARSLASLVLALAALCSLTSGLLAEDRSFGPFKTEDARPGVIRLDGEIVIGSALDFRRALQAAPSTNTLLLNSPGGLVAIALLIADDVNQRKIATVVPAESGCFSACALIFFAGPSRTAIGKLGVHQISSDAPDLASAQLTISDIIDMLNRFGTPTDVLTTMFRTPASDIHVFTADEIRRFGINRITGAPVQATADASTPAPVPASAPPQPASVKPPRDKLAELLDREPADPPQKPRADRRTICSQSMQAYFSDWSQENGTALSRIGSAYAPEVSFFGKRTTRAAVIEEKRKFAVRWPERRYAIRAGSVSVTVTNGTCSLTGIVDWSASSQALRKNPRGSASFVFELDDAESPLITSESTMAIKAATPGMTASAGATQNTAADPGNIQVVSGQCLSSSHTAEGPIGSDLTQRQSRFFCDSAVVNFFPDDKGTRHGAVRPARVAS